MYIKKILFTLIFAFYSSTLISGVCTSGTSSLINIPIARVIDEKKVVIGMGYINNHVAYLANGIHDNFPFYINIGYLPRLEFSAGVVFVPGEKSYDGTDTYKDGVVSVQYQLYKESDTIPGISIGARDIYSFILLNTSYIALSKALLKKTHTFLLLHCGYGSDIINVHQGVPPADKKHPVGHTIVGVFGGMEINWNNRFSYMIEYDTQKINTGIRFFINPYIELELDVMDMSQFGGGFQINFSL